MRLKNTLLAAVSVLTLGAAGPALASEPHVGIHLVFGIPGVYVAPPPPVVVYPAPRPPVVVVKGHRHYHPGIGHYRGHKHRHHHGHYEGRRFKEVQVAHERRQHQYAWRDEGRWERRGR